MISKFFTNSSETTTCTFDESSNSKNCSYLKDTNCGSPLREFRGAIDSKFAIKSLLMVKQIFCQFAGNYDLYVQWKLQLKALKLIKRYKSWVSFTGIQRCNCHKICNCFSPVDWANSIPFSYASGGKETACNRRICGRVFSFFSAWIIRFKPLIVCDYVNLFVSAAYAKH